MTGFAIWNTLNNISIMVITTTAAKALKDDDYSVRMSSMDVWR